MSKPDLTSANPHYVENVMALTKTKEVVASEDVFDAKGVKLIAKGAKIDEGMHERLVRFKLRKPLESSLGVEGGVNADSLVREAESLLADMQPLAALVKSSNAEAKSLSILKAVRLDGVSTMMLTMEEGAGHGALRHSVLATLTALAMGIKLNLNDSTLSSLAMAGILHDVGELYVSPEFRRPTRPLTPEEWKHIAAHPRIGQLVLEETTQYPKEVSIAISEHHERSNGFGYPRRVNEKSLSPLGKILMVSEVLCGIFPKGNYALERAGMAFKLISGEYPAALVSLISSVPPGDEQGPRPTVEDGKAAQLIARSQRIEQLINASLTPTEYFPDELKAVPAVAALVGQVRERLLMLRHAANSTGLFSCNDMELSPEDAAEIALELETIIYELEWRLRELARLVTLSILSMTAEQKQPFEIIITCLVSE
jgi:hypothetical protein